MLTTATVSIEDLITRRLQGWTTPAEDAYLAEWRESDPENEERYRSLAAVWSLVESASPISDADVPPDVDLIIAEADAGLDGALDQQTTLPLDLSVAREMRSTREQRVLWTRAFLMGALAASVAIVGIGLGLFSDRLPGRGDGEAAYRTVATTADAGATLTLYDGTAVRLAPSSELRVVQVGDHPIVQLRGRAYFGVVPDPARTFTVQTEYGDATALGTRFEVRTDEQELQVLVVQGKVRVSAAGSAVDIGEGMMTRSVEGEPLYATRVADVESRLDWLGRTLVFRATPLTKVLSEIERRYDVRVTLETAALSPLEVTAIFTNQPVEDVILVVCRIVGARCAFDEGRYRIGIGSSTAGSLPLDPSLDLAQ